jgi:hypothetical protein
MSHLGHKQTWRLRFTVSALPPKADIPRRYRDGYSGPASCPGVALFDSSQRDQPTFIGLLVFRSLGEISVDRLFA